MNHDKMIDDFGRMMNKAVWHGVLEALKVLWPFILVVVTFVILKEILARKVDRAVDKAIVRRRVNKCRTVGDLMRLDAVEFGEVCRGYLSKDGCSVRDVVPDKDRGVFLIGEKGGRKMIAQGKSYRGQAVDVGEMQKFLAAMQGHRAESGYFLTSSGFTPGAESLALGVRVTLVDGEGLLRR